MCGEGGRTYLGRSAACCGNVTESGVIHSDRAAEVSRRHSTHESEEGLNGRERLVGQGTQEPMAAENPVLSGLLAGKGRVKPNSIRQFRDRTFPGETCTQHPARAVARHALNSPNRRMRTRMYGGVGGENGRPFLLSRLQDFSAKEPQHSKG